MKIVQVCPRYYPYIGGIEKHVKEVSERLVQKGFDVEVFTTDPSGSLPPEDVINGVRVRRFKSFAPAEIGYFSNSLYHTLRRVKCDIIHAHGYRALPMLLAALAKNSNKAKFVVTTHLGFSKVGRSVYPIYNSLFGRFILSKADKIVIVSQAELEEIPLLRKYENKVVLIPIGIDTSKIEEYFYRDKTSDTLNLLYVGRIEKKKGLDELIKIMTMLQNEPIRLTIVGEGPYASKILPIVHKMQNIEFKGKVSEHELYELYANSHVFILLSEFESHSVSLTEAMAFGVIPIVTNVGGNKYIVDNETGFLVDYPIKVSEVVRTIKMLYLDRSILKQKSIASRKRALTNFEIKKTLHQLMKLYSEVFNENGGVCDF